MQNECVAFPPSNTLCRRCGFRGPVDFGGGFHKTDRGRTRSAFLSMNARKDDALLSSPATNVFRLVGVRVDPSRPARDHGRYSGAGRIRCPDLNHERNNDDNERGSSIDDEGDDHHDVNRFYLLISRAFGPLARHLTARYDWLVSGTNPMCPPLLTQAVDLHASICRICQS
jgi:hypothetical protein